MADDDSNKRGNLRTFCCNHVKSIVTIILMFAMVFCVVMIVMVHKWNYESTEAKYISRCLDVAIIGAGLSGSYAAWKMKDKGLNVHVYEMSDHVGGLLHTLHLPEYPDLNLELGVMSYDAETQPRLAQLIHALQLPPVTSRPLNRDPPGFYLRGSHVTLDDINGAFAQYKLRPFEANKNPSQLKSDYADTVLGGEWYKNELVLATTDGLLLYKQGFLNAVSKAASSEGMSLLRDTARWSHHVTNDNAAQLLFVDWPHTEKHVYTRHQVLYGGMQSIPKALITQFLNTSKLHSIKYNRRLACVRAKHGFYQLIFIKTKNSEGNIHDLRDSTEVCTKKVVVAVPLKSQTNIEWKPFDSEFIYSESLNSLVEYPVIRVFFIYRSNRTSSLWRDALYRKDIYTDLPIRHYKYLGSYNNIQSNSTDKYHAFLVAEVDGEHLDFIHSLIDLRSFSGEHQYSCNDTRYLVTEITRHIATLCNVRNLSEMPKPEQVIVVDYTRNKATGSWYNWKRGAHWENIERNMTKPQFWEDVFFVGGLSRDNMDGVIENVDNFMAEYFPSKT